MDTIKELELKKTDIEYVLYNPQDICKPKHSNNFEEDGIIVNHVNLKHTTYKKEIITKSKK